MLDRPDTITKKMYVEFDLDAFQKTGKIVPVGEPFTASFITQDVSQDAADLIYAVDLFTTLEKLGTKKMKVLNYLFDHKGDDNHLNITNTQLAKIIGVSRKTVIDTVKVLEDAGLLHRKGSVLTFSDGFAIKSDGLREAYLMRHIVNS